MIRAPARRPRMLSRNIGAGFVREVEAERVVVRIAVPPRVVRMVEFGLGELANRSTSWWRHVERSVAELVDAHAPRGAAHVRAWLDDERFEVVVEYGSSAVCEGSRPGTFCA